VPFIGLGFDSCTVPSTSSTQAWLGSPYRAMAVYLGGANRACPDGNLSAEWVTAVQGQGWSLIPIYVGLQAPCTDGFSTIDPGQAVSQGSQAAGDAASRARDFGLGQGTAIFFDMEAYDPIGGPCSGAVTAFLTGWSTEIEHQGDVSGVYGSLGSVLADLVDTRATRPDLIWFANWDGVVTTSDPAIPGNLWSGHRRIKQYLGGHDETYGGVTINIDSNAVDAILRLPPLPPPTATPTRSPSPRPPSPRPSGSARPRPSR
jgi:hypothetical protein